MAAISQPWRARLRPAIPILFATGYSEVALNDLGGGDVINNPFILKTLKLRHLLQHAP